MKYKIIQNIKGVELGYARFNADSDQDALSEFSHKVGEAKFRAGLKLELVEELKGNLLYVKYRDIAYATQNDEIIVLDPELTKFFTD